MTLQVSERGRTMPASPIRKLMPLADAAKRRGVRVYHLNIGQPDLETPAPMRAKLALAPKVLAYTPSAGTAECLASLVEYYRRVGVTLSADQLVVTTGGSEAILFALLACAGAGDEALVVEPFYTNYLAFAAMAGVRLVLLCNPGNPTGTVYRRDELEAVAGFCREHGLFLVADEVYREFVYDGRRAESVLALPGCEEIGVLVDSLSKRYSACGIRLGCLATRNRDVHAAALRMAQARLSPPGLAQLVALGASELPPDYAQGVVREYQARRDVLYEGLSRLPGVLLRKPEGAFYFVARLPVEDTEDFAAWLLSDFSHEGATVMLAPAGGFYATPGLGRDEVRIAYVLRTQDLEAAVRILAQAIPRYQAAQTARLAGARARA